MNPFKIPAPALIPFSGGRTSGHLLWRVLQAYGGALPHNIHVAFCNTGLEHNKTLDFVHEVEQRWNVVVHWLEFDLESPHRTKFVSYETASRNGEPMRQIIESRPTQHLFNPVSRYCTGSAKARRMNKLMHQFVGLEHWSIALGLRADEMKRVERALARSGRDRQTVHTPLATAGLKKEDIGTWWRQQPFDLELPNIGGVTPLGNCIQCPLKKRSKLVSACRVMPESADWWIAQEKRMEQMIEATPRIPGNWRWVTPRDKAKPPHRVWDKSLPSSPERRHRFHKDGTSYEDLQREAIRQNETNAPIDDGFDTDSGIDCMCTD